MSRPVTMAQVVRAFGMRRAVALARTAARAAGYLVAVRAALPGWLQAMLGVALVCTCLPGVPDFGLDEAIYLVAWPDAVVPAPRPGAGVLARCRAGPGTVSAVMFALRWYAYLARKWLGYVALRRSTESSRGGRQCPGSSGAGARPAPARRSGAQPVSIPQEEAQ